MSYSLNATSLGHDLSRSDDELSAIGIGTTGLGSICNTALQRDKERRIREYNTNKDKERMVAKATTRVVKKDRKHGDRESAGKTLAQKIEEQKQLRRNIIVAERQVMEKEMAEDRDRAVRLKAEKVEAERKRAQESKEEQKKIRMDFEVQRREQIRSDVAAEREFLETEEVEYEKEIAVRHEIQKNVREQERVRAIKEREVFEQSIQHNGVQLRKKLAALQVENKQIAVQNLNFKQELIKGEKKEREKRVQRRKLVVEQNHEKLQKRIIVEKEELAKELKERQERRVQETKAYIQQLKEIRSATVNEWSAIRAKYSRLTLTPSPSLGASAANALNASTLPERAATSMK